MKNLLVLASLLLLVSCSEDPKVQAIEKYTQTIGNTETDLDFNKLEFSKIKPLTGIDSARIVHEAKWKDPFHPDSNYFEQFEKLYQERYDSQEASIERLDSLINATDDIDLKVRYSEMKTDYAYDQVDVAGDLTDWKNKNKEFTKYINKGDEVLYEGYHIKYEIRNPMLDAKQTITDTFYFQPKSDQLAFKK